MERFCSVLGKAPGYHPTDVCASYGRSCRGRANRHSTISPRYCDWSRRACVDHRLVGWLRRQLLRNRSDSRDGRSCSSRSRSSSVEKCTVRRCLCGSSSISGRYLRCRDQSIRSDVLSVSGRRGPRDVESAQAGTETGAGGLAFRRKKSFPLFAISSRRSVCRFATARARCSGYVSFCQSRQVTTSTKRGRRDRSDRAPVSIHDTRTHVR